MISSVFCPSEGLYQLLINVIKHQAGVCDFDKLNDALVKALKQ